MRKIISRTVFSPIKKDWTLDKILAVLFHRTAVTLYFLYFLWGIATILRLLPGVLSFHGDIITTAFALLVIPIALLACIGALYFPKYARLEMYTAASFVTLVIGYEIFVVIDVVIADVIPGETVLSTSLILITSRLVVPLARLSFIYASLMKQAAVLDE